MEYFAFGETFIEEHKNSNNSPYKFNGKELDEESGLYYYGARYYDPRISIWASIDPLAEKYPDTSPYAYCANNPINFIDPDGREPIKPKPPYYIIGFYSEPWKRDVNEKRLASSAFNLINNLNDNALRFFGHGTTSSMFLSYKNDINKTYVNSVSQLENLITNSGTSERWSQMKKDGGCFISYACNNGQENGCMQNYSKKEVYKNIVFVGASTEVHPNVDEASGKFYSGDGKDKTQTWNIYKEGVLIGTRPWNWQPTEIDSKTYKDIEKPKQKGVVNKIIDFFKN